MNLITEIRTIRFKDGRVSPVLFGQNDQGIFLPLFYPNLFIDQLLSSKSENTQKQALLAIRCLLAWSIREEIDIEKRMRSLKLLDLTRESHNLKNALLLEFRSLFNQAVRVIGQPAIPSFVPERHNKQIANATFNIRMIYVSQYLSWLVSLGSAHLPYEERAKVTQDVAKQKRWFDDNHLSVDEAKAGKPLTEEQEKILWDVINPEAPNNVWSARSKFRNYLILRVYIETGMRKRELMTLSVNSINPCEYKINITKIRNDKKDTRRDKGKVKTRGRTVGISRDLSQLIQVYILGDRRGSNRRSIGTAKKHSFLFTSLSGSPISSTSITNIFSKLKRIPELRELTPHVLRYTFTIRLTEKFNKENLNKDLVSSLIKTSLGWSCYSHMDAKYNEEMRIEKIKEMSEERQRIFNYDK